MTKTQKIIAGLSLGLICGVFLMSAVSKSDRSSTALTQPVPTLTESTWKPPETTVQSVAPTVVATPTPPFIAENGNSGPDGKEVLATDGKEVLPMDGKETLAPVGQMLPGLRPEAIDPSTGAPPTEFLNPTKPTTTKPASDDLLLAPANPENVGGPVVSPETR
jgi:hypothetical protein